MTRSSWVLSTGLLVSLGGLPVVSAQAGEGAPGLHSLARAAGKLFFGTATDTNNFNDTAYMQIVNNSNEFGILVPENSMKWQPTEPTQDDFVFANPDRVRALAEANKQMFRCHTLTWFQQLPQFITQTTWTRDTLTAAIQTHIANVVGHYAGACYSWDAVNEALNDGNGTLRTSVFSTTLGTDFIPLSFRAAAAADPAAKLYYNDFSLESGGSKTDAALDIVRLVQNSSARIDGVGFQGHLIAGATPSAADLAAVFARFTALGVEVAVTELDVRITPLAASGTPTTTNNNNNNNNNSSSSGATAAQREQQARDYASVVSACLMTERCVGLVVWQFSDRYSWVPSTFKGAGEACLYDQNYVKKPAWTSVSSVLAAAATARSGSGSGNNGSAAIAAVAAVPTSAAPAPGAVSTGGDVKVASESRTMGAGICAVVLAAVCSISLSMFA